MTRSVLSLLAALSLAIGFAPTPAQASPSRIEIVVIDILPQILRGTRPEPRPNVAGRLLLLGAQREAERVRQRRATPPAQPPLPVLSSGIEVPLNSSWSLTAAAIPAPAMLRPWADRVPMIGAIGDATAGAPSAQSRPIGFSLVPFAYRPDVALPVTAAASSHVPLPLPLQRVPQDAPPLDPERPFELAEPDAAVVAVLADDVARCWRDVQPVSEARWARLSVDIALDRVGRPTERSIRLTGFGGVLSSEAEVAFRAAHRALALCADTSNSAPSTQAVTLLFDSEGVRLR